MKLVLLLALVMAGCAVDPIKQEQTGIGFVRSVRWGDRHTYAAVVHETDNGFLKLLSPVCGDAVSVWTGYRCNIIFHWDGERACYQIESAVREP